MISISQKRTFRSAIGMSAILPKADMCGAARDVCFVPIAESSQQIVSLFDHLVGASEQRSAGKSMPSDLAVLRLTSR